MGAASLRPDPARIDAQEVRGARTARLVGGLTQPGAAASVDEVLFAAFPRVFRL
jgi:hypothetical protein